MLRFKSQQARRLFTVALSNIIKMHIKTVFAQAVDIMRAA
jgi:hypothetical protein